MSGLPDGDLFALTAALVDVPSESRSEQRLVDLLEVALQLPHLTVDRIGDNLVARTNLNRAKRLILGGHTDTVPAVGNAAAVIDGDRLYGVGSTDMKGGLAVMLELARRVAEPAVDVSYVFYAREEIAIVHNGLREIAASRPDLLEGDVALLGEPTSGAIEAGCQGTMRLRVVMAGERAHTARPWMGSNAIHRLGRVIEVVANTNCRMPMVDGCEYREALQIVDVKGGVAGNVVPDRAEILINHRFAPDRTPSEAEAHVRSVLAPVLSEGDTLELVEMSPSARPGLDDPLIAALIEKNDLEVRAKLGWTDVAFFSELGVPASNFGPGDPTLAHTAGEYLERESLESTFAALQVLISEGG